MNMKKNPYMSYKYGFLFYKREQTILEPIICLLDCKVILRRFFFALGLICFNKFSNCVRITISFPNEVVKEDIIIDFDKDMYSDEFFERNLSNESVKYMVEQNKVDSSSYHQNMVQIDERNKRCCVFSDNYNENKKKAKVNESSQPPETTYPLFNDNFGNHKQGEAQNFTTEPPLELKSTVEVEHNKHNLQSKPKTARLIFQYSTDYIIRSEFLDDYLKYDSDDVNLVLKDISENIINMNVFKVLLITLRFGYHPGLMSLNRDQFLEFVILLTDLTVYSESGVLDSLYKNLFSFIFCFEPEFYQQLNSNSYHRNAIIYRKAFIPFLGVLFDSIEVIFDFERSELCFYKNTGIRVFNLLYTGQLNSSILRTTPEALNIIYQHDNMEKQNFLSWFLNFYKIEGIRISANNFFYTECKDPDMAYNFLQTSDSPLGTIVYTNPNIFTIIMQNYKNDIKLIEFERIVLSENDIKTLILFDSLEILILVKCSFNIHSGFLEMLYIFFSRLKILKLIDLFLTSNFFNNLLLLQLIELDLSFSTFIGSPNDLKFETNSIQLTTFSMNGCSLPSIIIDSYLKSQLLKNLSIRNVDLTSLKPDFRIIQWQKSYHFLDISGCAFGNILDFFSSNLISESLILKNLKNRTEALKILKQESLYNSTKYLSYSGEYISDVFFNYFKMFRCLESIKIHETLTDTSLWQEYNLFFVCQLKSLDLSRNTLSKNTLTKLPLFSNLEQLNISKCNLKNGFMGFLYNKKQFLSLKRLDISRNQLNISDILVLNQLLNLTHLKITLENNILSKYYKEYGTICFKKLESLVLVSTYFDETIFHFVISNISLLKLKLKFCKVFHSGLTKENIYNLKFLKKITFCQTLFHQEVLKILDLFKMLRIYVIYH
ncbi:hypothetical protein CWI37_1043p0020 [Hamiltosporidium tvaerminnensis]|uniref:Leucine-rich repeat-containing protein n=1 Tax=Hamiltosporidium tvaerminnensis TaxID=1176355 RepID=A0A4V2JUI7_9MICR|nr:hypothetical protein CWI37_1043p0020 [Hamiltosporidium tvaerminnensis]